MPLSERPDVDLCPAQRVNLACPKCGLAHNAPAALHAEIQREGATEYCEHDGRVFIASSDRGHELAAAQGYEKLVPHADVYVRLDDALMQQTCAVGDQASEVAEVALELVHVEADDDWEVVSAPVLHRLRTLLGVADEGDS